MGQTILLSCSAAIASKPTDLHVEKKKEFVTCKAALPWKGQDITLSSYICPFSLVSCFFLYFWVIIRYKTNKTKNILIFVNKLPIRSMYTSSKNKQTKLRIHSSAIVTYVECGRVTFGGCLLFFDLHHIFRPRKAWSLLRLFRVCAHTMWWLSSVVLFHGIFLLTFFFFFLYSWKKLERWQDWCDVFLELLESCWKKGKGKSIVFVVET